MSPEGIRRYPSMEHDPVGMPASSESGLRDV